MCGTCNNISCSGCGSVLTGAITFDGTTFTCIVDSETQFEIASGDNLNAILTLLANQLCTLFNDIDSGTLDGSQWFVDAGAPNDVNGDDGDFYLNSTNGDVYQKVLGTWGSASANITGPAGATGSTGSTGNDGISFRQGAGVPGAGLGNDGDSYVNLSSPELDLYTKSAGVWSDTGLNMRGVDGAAGATGAAGNDGADGADGFNFLQGNGVPGAGLGNNGDSYLDNATGDIYLKSGGSWSLTGNIFTGAIVGLEHLFNAQKTVEQTIVGQSQTIELEFSDDNNATAGRFDYGNTWITNTWTAPSNLTDVDFSSIMNMEVTGVDGAQPNSVTVDILKNAISIGNGSFIIPAATPDTTIISLTMNTGVEAFTAGDLVTIEMSTPAGAEYATFEGKVLTDGIFFNTQL